MSEMNQNIDDLFRNELNTHSEEPPAYIWDSINSELAQTRVANTRIVVWRTAAAAAFIGVLILSGLLFFDLNKNLNTEEFTLVSEQIEQDVKVRETEVLESKSIPSKTAESSQVAKKNDTKKALSKPNVIVVPEKKNTVGEPSPKGSILLAKNNNPPVSDEEEDSSNSKEVQIIVVGENTSPVNNNLGSLSNEDTTRIFIKHESQNSFTNTTSQQKDYIPFNTEPAVYNPTKSKSKYVITLSGEVAPGYSDKEATGGPQAANQESGISTLTGGLNVNVKSKRKWSVETGIYYSQVGQKFSNNVYSDDVPLFMSAVGGGSDQSQPNAILTNSMGNINLKNPPQFIDEGSKVLPGMPNPSNPELPNASTLVGAIDIQQELDFIEVPLLVRYHILDRGLNVSIAGGMSTNFLVDNNVYYMEGGSRQWIGETDQINNVNYSAVFGFGIQAPLWKSVNFNIEPRVKYFMNSVSSESNTSYKPYSLGLFTGISYSF